MRFYTQQHQYYCGIDLHARAMYVCVLDAAGNKLMHRNVPAQPAPLLRLLEPYRPDVAVGVECMFTWYWLADLCEAEGLPFVLGHALYMKAVHGGKARRYQGQHFASYCRLVKPQRSSACVFRSIPIAHFG